MTSENDGSLRGLIGRLKACPDDVWWQYLLKKDPLYGKIPPAAQPALIAGAVGCAAAVYDRLTAGYGRRSPAAYATALGLTVATEDIRTDYDYILISCYTAGPPLIKLSATALDLLAGLIERETLPAMLSRAGLADLAVAHELFHHLEEGEPASFTRQKTVEYRALGILKYKVCPLSASEIAAVHFSRLMTGLEYSPAVYELLLLYLQKQPLAEKLIGELLAAADNR